MNNMHNMNEAPNLGEALTLQKVAEYFDVTPRTIRIWLKKDENFPRPFKKFGTLRFKRTDVECYWKENCVPKEEAV